MKRRRRLLALVVNARDLAQHASTRAAVAAALDSDALDLLQLRADGCDSDRSIETASDVLCALRAPGHADAPALIINAPLTLLTTRQDLLATAFDGWHVKERDLFHDDLPQLIRRVRTQMRSDTSTRNDKPILGCSVHSVASAVHAARLGFDYIQVGTMFLTPSHPEKTSQDELEGPSLLQAIVAAAAAPTAHSGTIALPPLVAVGGINTAHQTREVLRAGASGVAVIRGILAASDGARAAAAAYRSVLDAPIDT